MTGNSDSLPSRCTFRIDETCDWIVLRMQFEQIWTTLFVRDPDGKTRFHYLHHLNTNIAVLHRDPAQASFLALPGELPVGEWTIEFYVAPRQYTIEWTSGTGEVPAWAAQTVCSGTAAWADSEGALPDSGAFWLNRYDWSARHEKGRRWYKGDFHTHTTLSDGKMTPLERMRHAETLRLDFFAATDHHVLSTVWPQSPMLVIPGIEITSSRGHFNALGLRSWVDWRTDSPDGGMESEAGMNRILRETAEAEALRSINHPMTHPWEWLFQETELASIDTMEIWNDPTYHNNPASTEKTLLLWNALWNDGYRITGIGGSDTHMLPTESYTNNGPPSIIGDPGTYVLADSLSAEEILNAVRLGRVYVSREPEFDHCCKVGLAAFPPGSDLTEAVQASSDGNVTLHLTFSKLAEGRIHLIENGETVITRAIDCQTEHEFTLCWQGRGYRWARFEIRKEDGELLAFTNPVFYGHKSPTLRTWKDLLEAAGIDQ